jgi:hypothetical protein
MQRDGGMAMVVDKGKNVVEVGDGWNQHGFPRGYHFVPKEVELIGFLEEQQAGRALPDPLPNIFHHVRIRDYHPAELYGTYFRRPRSLLLHDPELPIERLFFIQLYNLWW